MIHQYLVEKNLYQTLAQIALQSVCIANRLGKHDCNMYLFFLNLYDKNMYLNYFQCIAKHPLTNANLLLIVLLMVVHPSFRLQYMFLCLNIFS